jgi:hypothetical protein
VDRRRRLPVPQLGQHLSTDHALTVDGALKRLGQRVGVEVSYRARQFCPLNLSLIWLRSDCQWADAKTTDHEESVLAESQRELERKYCLTGHLKNDNLIWCVVKFNFHECISPLSMKMPIPQAFSEQFVFASYFQRNPV